MHPNQSLSSRNQPRLVKDLLLMIKVKRHYTMHKRLFLPSFFFLPVLSQSRGYATAVSDKDEKKRKRKSERTQE